MQTKNRGFTLIELLVVISIIGVLSAVVLTSLQNAKIKAKDAVVFAAIDQFKSLLTLEYGDTGSYGNLLPNFNGSGAFSSPTAGVVTWIDSAEDCDDVTFLGTRAIEATRVCKEIAKHTPDGTPSLILGADVNSLIPNAQYWTISALVPSTQRYYCVSNLGNTSNNNTIDGVTDGGLPGCWNDPTQ
jgi:prepilin-type N-terminal cleavage/methylation domain-containing protein